MAVKAIGILSGGKLGLAYVQDMVGIRSIMFQHVEIVF